jgi:hypothetical protein
MRNKRKVNAVKGTQGFVETRKSEAKLTDLQGVFHARSDGGTVFEQTWLDEYGTSWNYFDDAANQTFVDDKGVEHDVTGQKGWRTTTAADSTMQISNDGRSTVGYTYRMVNSDGVVIEGETDYEAEAAERMYEAERWGAAPIEVGQWTSGWGQVRRVVPLAPGITLAECSQADSGGILLSAERNDAMPETFRNQDRWYELDVERQMIRHTFPEEFVAPEDTFRGVPNSEAVVAVRQDANDALAGMLPPV